MEYEWRSTNAQALCATVGDAFRYKCSCRKNKTNNKTIIKQLTLLLKNPKMRHNATQTKNKKYQQKKCFNHTQRLIVYTMDCSGIIFRIWYSIFHSHR